MKNKKNCNGNNSISLKVCKKLPQENLKMTTKVKRYAFKQLVLNNEVDFGLGGKHKPRP